MPAPSSSRSTPLLALGVAVLALAAQLPAVFRSDFVWDDVPLLLGNDLYTSPARWGESLGVPLGIETSYWRPLATSSFLLETLVHGGAAAGFRLTAALLHGVAAALGFVLLRRLLRSPVAAFLAAAAWALHPVNVEAVTWISARFDLLSGLFVLGALVAAGSPTGSDEPASRRARWGVAVCAAAALLSKENAVVLPFLLVAWCGALAGGPGLVDGLRTRARLLGSAFAGLGVVALWRVERLGFLFRTSDSSVREAGGLLEHVLLVGRATATYVLSLLLPWWAAGPAHHAARPIPADDLLGWSGLALLVAGLGLLWWTSRRDRVSAWLIAGFGLALAPVLQIVPLDLAGGLHAADRFLYLPSFFAIALLARGAVALVGTGAGTRPRVVVGAATTVLVALCAGRLAMLPHWSSSPRFWAWAAEEAPRSPITLANRVAALMGSGWPGDAEIEEAESLSRQLVHVDPERRYGHALVEILLLRGKTEEAAQAVESALAVAPEDPLYLILYGRVNLERRRPVEALRAFQRAVEVCEATDADRYVPRLPEALAGLAEGEFLTTGDAAAARVTVAKARRALAHAPDTAVARVALALCLVQDFPAAKAVIGDGSRVSAIDWPGVILAAASYGMGPIDVEALADAAQRAGVPELTIARTRALGRERNLRWDLAAMHYRRVTELAPDDAAAWDDYGYSLFETGDDAGCEAALRRALEVDPAHGNAQLHLGVLLRILGREDEGVEVLTQALAQADAAELPALAALLRKQLGRSPEDARKRGR